MKARFSRVKTNVNKFKNYLTNSAQNSGYFKFQKMKFKISIFLFKVLKNKILANCQLYFMK